MSGREIRVCRVGRGATRWWNPVFRRRLRESARCDAFVACQALRVDWRKGCDRKRWHADAVACRRCKVVSAFSLDQSPHSLDQSLQLLDRSPHSLDESLQSLDTLRHSLDQSPQLLDGLPHSLDQSPRLLDQLAHSLDQSPQLLDGLPHSLDQSPRLLDQLQHSLDQSPRLLDQLAHSLDQSPQSLDVLPRSLDQMPRTPLRNRVVDMSESPLWPEDKPMSATIQEKPINREPHDEGHGCAQPIPPYWP